MKVMCISDTHDKHSLCGIAQEIKSTKPDVIIHAGDVTSRGTLLQLKSFCRWFDSLTVPHKVFIGGNHDRCLQDDPVESREIINNFLSIIYLEDSFTEIMGFKIWGSPWQPWFGDWAFNFPKFDNLQGFAEAKKKWEEIPEDIDVLVTHGPPYDILDTVQYPGNRDPHVGCSVLRKRVETLSSNRLKLHVFGHIHEASGQFRSDNGVTFCNASCLNFSYKPDWKKSVLEL